jgi:hypothetical protein
VNGCLTFIPTIPLCVIAAYLPDSTLLHQLERLIDAQCEVISSFLRFFRQTTIEARQAVLPYIWKVIFVVAHQMMKFQSDPKDSRTALETVIHWPLNRFCWGRRRQFLSSNPRRPRQ